MSAPSPIPITRPCFGQEERELLLQVLDSGWVVQGPMVARFEALFGAFTGSPHCVATSSCTTALHLALRVLGVGPGDEVIVPSFTWIATANAVEYVGARPVLCDIDPSTYNLDPASAAAQVGAHTRAIVPVHLFGLCAPMAAVLRIARASGLAVVEDAACALGARYQGAHAGTLGDVGCFSFHPRKALTTGEGGMLTTARAEWAAQARALRDHGASLSDRQRHEGPKSHLLPDFATLGYNYRMTDLQGALGCAQMGRAADLLAARRQRAARYDAALQPLGWLRPPRVPPRCEHGYQAYVCLFAPEEPTLASLASLHRRRNAVMEAMGRAGIATRPGTHAVHLQEYYARRYGIRPADLPQAWIADRLSLALPLFADR
ncbi:MAG: DegT/DnrJ/EryC1/StrS family aminotransferase, partial [Candidatus Latescibacterota bacterium]